MTSAHPTAMTRQAPTQGHGTRAGSVFLRTTALIGWLTAVIGGCAGVALRILRPVPVVPNTFGLADSGIVAFAILGIAWATIGAMLVVQRPQNRVGRYMVVVGVGYALGILAAAITFGAVADHDAVLAGVAGWATVLLSSIGGLLIYLAFIFPTGRGHTPGWERAGRLFLVIMAAALGYLLIRPGRLHLFPTIENPFGFAPELESAVGADVAITFLGAALFVTPLVGGAVATRYRTADVVQRQQMKWAASAIAVSLVALVVTAAVPVVMGQAPEAPLTIYALSGTVVPIAIGIAILRHRLYDIDRLISRGLAYGTVSLILGSLFAIAAIGLGGVLATVGQGRYESLAVAASTLLVLGLFQPLRRRVQRVVDRHFDREHYDAERTVGALVGRLRADVDLESVRADVVGVMEGTFRPTYAALWLRPTVRGGVGSGSARPRTT